MLSVYQQDVTASSSKFPILPWQLIILIALALVRGLIYLSLFPPWVAPDEPAHFEAIRILGQEGQNPSYAYYNATPVNAELSESFQTHRMWELLERVTPTQLLNNGDSLDMSFINYPYPGRLVFADTYPILPHILLSPISILVSPFDIATELYFIRFISVVLAVIVTGLAWFVTRKVFPNQPQLWLAIPAFIVFLPMHTHIFAAANTDVFAILLTSVLLLLLISFFDKGASKTKVAIVICLIVLALLTKRTVIFTLLWAGLTGILYLGYRRQWTVKRIVTVGLITATAIGLAFFWVILNSDLLVNSVITLFNMNIGRHAFFIFANQGLSFQEFAIVYIKSGLFAFITFWGDFGGANINIPWPWAWGLMILCGVIILGALIYLYKALYKFEGVNRFQQNVLIIFVTGIILSLANAFFPVLAAGPRWGPPARYFFPVIIPIATLFFLGVRQLCPAKYRQSYLLPGWLLALVAYDTIVITQVLIPFIYG